MLATPTLILILPFLQAGLAAPTSISPSNILANRDAPSSTDAPIAIPQDTANTEFLRPAQFSRVAYCSTGAVTSWQCGSPCNDLGADIEVLQAGGDNGLIPQYFIAHDPSTQSIVVAHQGTDPHELLSVLNDVEFPLVSLNSSRFPNANGSVQVHDGFQKTFERTADGILAGVQSGLTSKNVSKVLVTGHSQGAAIAVMDAAMLRQDLDPSVQMTTTVFGLPRGGDAAWADFLDTTLGNTLVHMTNQNDPVPVVPPRALGYQHPSGEVHIRAVDSNGNATDVVACPGQENQYCSDDNSFVVDIVDGGVSNHLGPYVGNVSFGSGACPL